MSEFKIGDTVVHKATDSFKMVIIDNCRYKETAKITEKDPNRFECKYYNIHTNQWESKCFYALELVLSK